MGQTVEQYERDGYCIADEQIAPDDVLAKALQGMVAVRDGKFDMELPPTEHPKYDPERVVQDQQSASVGYRTLRIGDLSTSGTQGRRDNRCAQRVQVWASQLLIKPPGSASRRARRLASGSAVLAHVAARRRAFYGVDRAV